jgi:hypothetical protein
MQGGGGGGGGQEYTHILDRPLIILFFSPIFLNFLESFEMS